MDYFQTGELSTFPWNVSDLESQVSEKGQNFWNSQIFYQNGGVQFSHPALFAYDSKCHLCPSKSYQLATGPLEC